MNRFLHQNKATRPSLELCLIVWSHKYVTAQADSTLPGLTSTKTYMHVSIYIKPSATPSSFFPPCCTFRCKPEPKTRNHSKKYHKGYSNAVKTQTWKVFFVRIQKELLTKHNIDKWFRPIVSHIRSHLAVPVGGLYFFTAYTFKKFSER